VARLGVERNERWEPLHEIVGAGIPLALGSDGPLDPFANIALAVTHASSPLTREQALIAYTQGSAYDEHLEADKGRLVPGMLADLAVLSRDIVERDPIEARSVLTIVGGDVVYDAATPASARSSARTE
ncbi:MAG TPA: amidohydrolase family protein, partial [Kofleriaceae bacterium]|nr:amidohydrolase family protein [Kofleriaceae bacterium]